MSIYLVALFFKLSSLWADNATRQTILGSMTRRAAIMPQYAGMAFDIADRRR